MYLEQLLVEVNETGPALARVHHVGVTVAVIRQNVERTGPAHPHRVWVWIRT
jgi:hypothetical protein